MRGGAKVAPAQREERLYRGGRGSQEEGQGRLKRWGEGRGWVEVQDVAFYADMGLDHRFRGCGIRPYVAILSHVPPHVWGQPAKCP